MNKFSISKLVGIFALHFALHDAYGQAQLDVRVPKKSQVIFNFVENNKSSELKYINPTGHDSVISQRIGIIKPTHLYFSNLVIVQSGKPAIHQFGSILLLPGDSMSFDRSNLKFSNSAGGERRLVDSILGMRAAYPLSDIRSLVEKDGIKQSLKLIDKSYRDNLNRTQSLRPGYDEKFLKALRAFSFIIKCQEISKIPFKNLSTGSRDFRMLDSCYNMIKINLEKFASINSPFTNGIIYSMVMFNAKKKGHTSGDLWDCFQFMDKKILENEVFSSFLLFQLFINSDGSKEYVDQKIQLIKKAGVLDARFNSLVLPHEIRSRFRLDTQFINIHVKTVNGKLMLLKDIFQENKIIYLDIWASWCVPCLAEIPFLKKEKNYLIKNNILYVGLSIDEDVENWKSTLSAHSLDLANQYIITANEKHKLETIFEMETIPRYLLLFLPDKILNIDAPRPSDSNNLHKAITIASELIR